MPKLLTPPAFLLLILSVGALSPAAAVSCTMCDSCDNPCLPPATPPPPPPTAGDCPPPPSSVPYYSPPPPSSGGSGGGSSYYNPPPPHHGGSGGGSYLTPPPPNPIWPYFPYYNYGTPPPTDFNGADGGWIKAFFSIYLFFFLCFVL